MTNLSFLISNHTIKSNLFYYLNIESTGYSSIDRTQ